MVDMIGAVPFDDQYDGSRAFSWLADFLGLSVDLVNFLLAQISALFLASLFRSLLHPSKVTAGTRHAFGLIVGLYFGYFCFGQQAIHIAGLPALCFVVIRTQNPHIVQRMVFVVAMVYLCCVHLHRLYYDYGSPTIDITAPLMIITQKVTTLAFSIHDGMHRPDTELNESQRFHAVRRIPSLLEYFAYCLHFQSLMAGPIVLYKDYIEFIEGQHILRHAPSRNGDLDNDQSGTRIIVEPSPTRTVIEKVAGSLVCAFIFMKFSPVYPIKNLKDTDFMDASGFVGKLWFVMNATTVVRFKYYHAWLLGDAICNNSLLGFNGYDETGRAKWDLISNINVFSFEFATNFRTAISHWNLGTNRWLRNVVYDRTPKRYSTVLTFALSAVWHGFYPGYYITFASGALIVLAARTARKCLRHRFQSTASSRQMYDIVTIVVTRVFMGYATFPFVVLEYGATLNMYLRLFMCLHLVTILTIIAMPLCLGADQPLNHKPKDVVASAAVPASLSDKHDANCDTNFNVPNATSVRHDTRTPIEATGPSLRLLRTHSSGGGATAPQSNGSSSSSNRDNLFESDAEMMRFNSKLERNGGGSFHHRISAGSFMHHGQIDAKF